MPPKWTKMAPQIQNKGKKFPCTIKLDLLRLSRLKRNVKWMKSVRFKTLHPWCNFALHVHSFCVKGFKVRVKKEALSSSSCVDWSACFSSWCPCHHPVAWEPAHWKDEVWNARMLFSRQGICELQGLSALFTDSRASMSCYSNVQSFRQLAELKHFPSAFSIGYNHSNWTSLKCLWFSITYCTSDQVLWSSLKTHTFFHSVSCFCVFTSSLYIIMSCYFFPSAFHIWSVCGKRLCQTSLNLRSLCFLALRSGAWLFIYYFNFTFFLRKCVFNFVCFRLQSANSVSGFRTTNWTRCLSITQVYLHCEVFAGMSSPDVVRLNVMQMSIKAVWLQNQ